MHERFPVIFLLGLIMAMAGCGSGSSRYIEKSYQFNEHYPFVYYTSTFEAMTSLDPDIKLFYSSDKHPKNVKIIVHGKRLARNKDCEKATIEALKRLQENAKKVGADAIINIKPTWEGKSLEVEGNKYFCAGGKVTFGIEWEGDLVKISTDSKEISKEDPYIDTPMPKPLKEAPEGAEKPVKVLITKNSDILFNNQEVSMGQLEKILTIEFQANPEGKVIIQADEETKHGKVVEVMDLAESVGFESIGLAVHGKK